MTRLYVSGPVAGRPSLNRSEFEKAWKRLRSAGFEADIPHEIIPPDATHEEAMILSISNVALFDPAQFASTGRAVPFYGGIALLPGWEGSEGARLEKLAAEAFGIPCMTVDEWIEGRK